MGTTNEDGYYIGSGLRWQEGVYTIEAVGENDIRSLTPLIDVKGREIGTIKLFAEIIKAYTTVKVIIHECNHNNADIYHINSKGEQLLIGRTNHRNQNKIFKYTGYWKEDTYRIMVTKSGFKPWISKEEWDVKGETFDIEIQNVVLE